MFGSRCFSFLFLTITRVHQIRNKLQNVQSENKPTYIHMTYFYSNYSLQPDKGVMNLSSSDSDICGFTVESREGGKVEYVNRLTSHRYLPCLKLCSEEPMINVAVEFYSVFYSLLPSTTSPPVKYFRTLCYRGTKLIQSLFSC